MFKKLGTSLNALSSFIPKRIGTSLNDQSKHVALTSELFETGQNEIPEELRNMVVSENIKEAKLKKAVKLKKLTEAYQTKLKVYTTYYENELKRDIITQDVQYDIYKKYHIQDSNMIYASYNLMDKAKSNLQIALNNINEANSILKKLKDDWNEKYDLNTIKNLDKRYETRITDARIKLKIFAIENKEKLLKEQNDAVLAEYKKIMNKEKENALAKAIAKEEVKLSMPEYLNNMALKNVAISAEPPTIGDSHISISPKKMLRPKPRSRSLTKKSDQPNIPLPVPTPRILSPTQDMNPSSTILQMPKTRPTPRTRKILQPIESNLQPPKPRPTPRIHPRPKNVSRTNPSTSSTRTNPSKSITRTNPSTSSTRKNFTKVPNEGIKKRPMPRTATRSVA
jgi:hypothetical protein